MAASLHSINIPNGISDVFFIFVLRRQVILQVILLDMGGEFESIFIPSYSLYGGKSAYSVKLPEQSMKVLDFQVLASEIISKI